MWIGYEGLGWAQGSAGGVRAIRDGVIRDVRGGVRSMWNRSRGMWEGCGRQGSGHGDERRKEGMRDKEV